MVKLQSAITPEDIVELSRLWEEHWKDKYSLPNRNNSVIDALTKNESGRITSYGQVKLFAELQLFLDPTARGRDKIQSLRLLMSEAFRGIDRVGLENIYCFIKDPDFALIIEKHYGFERSIQPGELLIRRL